MSNEQYPENDDSLAGNPYSKEAIGAIKAAERHLDSSRLKILLGKVGRFSLLTIMTYGGTTSFFQYKLALDKNAEKLE